jgi:hypothetical protein
VGTPAHARPGVDSSVTSEDPSVAPSRRRAQRRVFPVFKYSLSKRDYVCHTEHLYLRI